MATRTERNLSETWSDVRSAERSGTGQHVRASRRSSVPQLTPQAESLSKSWSVNRERSDETQLRMRAQGVPPPLRVSVSPARHELRGAQSSSVSPKEGVTAGRRGPAGLSAREAGKQSLSVSPKEAKRDRTKRSFEYQLWIKALTVRGDSHSPARLPMRTAPARSEKPQSKIEPEKDRFVWRYPRESTPPQDARCSPPQDVAGLPQACASRPEGAHACNERQSDVSDEVAAAVATAPCSDKVEEFEEFREPAAPLRAAASVDSGLAAPPSPIAPALAAVRWLLACCFVPRVDLWLHLACDLLVSLLIPAARYDGDSDYGEAPRDGRAPSTLAEAERRLRDARRDADECTLRLQRAQRRVGAWKHEVSKLQRREKRGATTSC